MLQHAFLVFRERGYNRVGLGMEAENENAMHLYERVGMRVLRQYDEYRKTYRPAMRLDQGG
jgi:ribosomal protein S18 acetylase RimI-like enzyme